MIGARAAVPRSRLLGLALLLGLFGLPGATRGATGAPPESLYRGLDEADVALARATVQDALETALSRRTRTWINETSGHSGSVRPLRTFRIADGRYCRQYREYVTSDDGRAVAVRIACRDRDGVWRVPRAPTGSR